MFAYLRKERLVDNDNTREKLKIFGKFTDKILVKKILSEFHIENLNFTKTLFVYDKFSDMNIDIMPEKFVIKANHDCGSCKIVTKNNVKENYPYFENYYNSKINSTYRNGKEPHYKYINPKIMCEEFIDLDTCNTEYKFHCIYNNIVCVTTITTINGVIYRKMLNSDFEELNFNQSSSRTTNIVKPNNFDKMKQVVIDILKKIKINYVRVDLYNVNELIYFGELTFTPSGLYSHFESKKFEILMLEFLLKKSVNYEKINLFLK